MSKRKLRTYDKAFKLNAVNYYLASGQSYEQVSEGLGIPVGTLEEIRVKSSHLTLKRSGSSRHI